jgi:hypothetical protein
VFGTRDNGHDLRDMRISQWWRRWWCSSGLWCHVDLYKILVFQGNTVSTFSPEDGASTFLQDFYHDLFKLTVQVYMCNEWAKPQKTSVRIVGGLSVNLLNASQASQSAVFLRSEYFQHQQSFVSHSWIGDKLNTSKAHKFMLNTVFWRATPCGLVNHQHFKAMYCFNLQG